MSRLSRLRVSLPAAALSYQNLLRWYAVLSGVLSGISLALALSITQQVENFGGMWLPGALFGLLFAVAHRWTSHSAVSFASLAALIYWLAVHIALKTYGVIQGDRAGDITYALIIAGLLAGGVGALILGFLAGIFTGRRLPWQKAARTMLLGGAFGGVFMLVAFADIPLLRLLNAGPLVSLGSATIHIGQMIRCSLAFLLWQVIIGDHIARNVMDSGNTPQQGSSFSDDLAAFLQGPIVQLIGLIGSIIGLFSYFFPGF